MQVNKEILIRVSELIKSPYRPPQIVKLKEEIEAKKKALQARYRELSAQDKDESLDSIFLRSITDDPGVAELVAMNWELEILFCQWLRGEIN